MIDSFFLEENDFHNAWARAVRYCLRFGKYFEDKRVKDINLIVVLTGKAIDQIKNKELHPSSIFKNGALEEYIKQFRSIVHGEFDYTYISRLEIGHGVSQLEIMRNKLLREKIGHRRIQSITWIPKIDTELEHPPCLQRIWIRKITKACVEVHLHWRSRDLFVAFQPNIIAIVSMLREKVLGDDFNIVKLLDFSNSAHIYERDFGLAKNVKLLPRFRGVVNG